MNGQHDRDAMLDLVAAYALGVLPASEHRLVTAFLLQDDAARAEFHALRPAADAIGLMAEEPVDSARSQRMKERLMAVAHAEAASPRVTPIGAARRAEPAGGSGFRLGMGVAAAAAVLIALVSTIQNFSLRSDIAAVNRHAAQLQSQVAEDATLQRRDREMVADIVAPDAQHFTVSSGEVIRHGGHVYFALSALPALPKGKVYQAWTLAKGAKNVAPSVTFVPAAGGVAIVALPENAADIAAVAVSVEPEGGSKTPTTKPTFVRPLS